MVICAPCNKDFGANELNYKRHLASEEHKRITSALIPYQGVGGTVGGTHHPVAISPEVAFIPRTEYITPSSPRTFIQKNWPILALGGVALYLMAASRSRRPRANTGAEASSSPSKVPGLGELGAYLPQELLVLIAAAFGLKLIRTELMAWSKLFAEWGKN